MQITSQWRTEAV